MTAITPYVFPGLPSVNDNLDYLLECVSEFYRIPVISLKSKSRIREVTDARQIFMLTANIHTRHSTSFIGMHVERDHATVLHATKQYDKDLTLRRKADNFLKTFGYIKQ